MVNNRLAPEDEANLKACKAKAEALIDCRLVPDQDPEKVFQCIKRHVEMMGYDNVKIENDGYIPSSKTDVNTPYLPAVEEICRDIYCDLPMQTIISPRLFVD